MREDHINAPDDTIKPDGTFNGEPFVYNEWEIWWCGMKVEVVTMNYLYNGKVLHAGEVVSYHITTDNDELDNAFRGIFDMPIDDEIENQTGCNYGDNVKVIIDGVEL